MPVGAHERRSPARPSILLVTPMLFSSIGRSSHFDWRHFTFNMWPAETRFGFEFVRCTSGGINWEHCQNATCSLRISVGEEWCREELDASRRSFRSGDLTNSALHLLRFSTSQRVLFAQFRTKCKQLFLHFRSLAHLLSYNALISKHPYKYKTALRLTSIPTYLQHKFAEVS